MFLVGPFNRPLFPEASYARAFVDVGMWALVDVRKSIQYQRYKLNRFTPQHPYTCTPSLVGHTVEVTLYGIPAKFIVGEDTAKNQVQIAENALTHVKTAVGAEPLPLDDFLHAVERALGQPKSTSDKLQKFKVAVEGHSISLKSYLMDALATDLNLAAVA